MPYSGSVLRRASARLSARRTAQESARLALQREVYQTVPQVAEIDRQLRATMAHVLQLALRTGEDPTEALRAVRLTNQALQEERSAQLLAHGYSPDALDDKPVCSKCGDRGWVGGEMCECLQLLCTEEQIKELSSLLDFGEQSFELFDFSYYSDMDPDGKGRTSRQKMKAVYDICWDYAHNFGRRQVRNLFLSGGTGLGKTFLSASIAKVVSENGFSVVYDTAGNIFAQFEAKKFVRDAEESREARDDTRRYLGCDLLIVDDLGSEMVTAFVQSTLYQLVNDRLVGGKRTVVSSNLTMDGVRDRYSPQIASRLEGEYRVLPFFGNDIRLEKKRRL